MSKKTKLDFIIKTQQDLINRLARINEWSLEANKKVMKTETDNWYLKWKVGYLEQKIKEHLPDATLYDKDNELFNEIKNGSGEEQSET